MPGNYYNKTLGTLFYTPDLSRQAYVGSPQRDNQVRLTWQVSPKQKVTFMQLVQDNCDCHYQVASNVSPEASPNSHLKPRLTSVTWTAPVTNRLLVQGGVAYVPGGLTLTREPGVTSSDIPVTELSTGYSYGASVAYTDPNGPNGRIKLDQTNGRFAVSYVTGSHAFKTGFTFLSADSGFDIGPQDQALSYELRKPTPDAAPRPVSVTYYAFPRWTHSRATKLALYLNDQWTLRNLTLNLGIRLDTLHAWNPAQSKPAGRWTPGIDFAKVDDVPNWKDVSPRVGAAYDLFGNGKTSVKGSVGRYVTAELLSLAGANNPQNTIVGGASRNWNDVNGDYIPQESELGPLSNSLFGTVVTNTRYADDVLKGWGVRPYSWSATAALQHELRPGMALTADYVRRWYGNFRVTDNLRVTPQDYDPFCVTAPVDARLPNGGGYQVCGYYDVKPTAFGAVSNVVTRASNFGTRTEVYNGFDVGINARFGQGGLLAAGVSTGQTVYDNCVVVDSPQQAQPGFCHVTNPFTGQTQIKVSGVYPLPWDLQASAVFQNLAGVPDSGTAPLTFAFQDIDASGNPIPGASYVATNAEIKPTLGRDLGACAGRVPCTALTTVNLVAPYDGGFENRLTQLDVRLTKIVRMGRARVRGMFDLYNVFNANTILGGMITRVGPSYLQPTSIVAGRLFKFSAQLDF